MGFGGFPKAGLELLVQLPTFDKEQFRRHAVAYKRDLQEPLKAFVEGIGPLLKGRVSPGIEFAAKTHGSIGPINNDVRFNPNAPTYKDHVLLRFWEGAEKKAAPTLYVRLTPSEVGFAAGAMFTDIAAWRHAVLQDGARLAAVLSKLVGERDADIVGDDLKRVPKGFDAEHPHADLLRHKWLQVRWPRVLPASVDEAGFVEYCATELERAAEVHRWLVRHLGSSRG